jgi:uncharacterized protein YecT (DUF1311 family)
VTYRLALLLAALAGMTVLPANAKDCEKEAENMAQVRACTGDELDRQLDATLQQTVAFVRAKDAHAAQLLTKAQDSWRAFATASCDYSMAARQTGQMENDARLQCWATFVNARIKVLNAYRRDFGKADF